MKPQVIISLTQLIGTLGSLCASLITYAQHQGTKQQRKARTRRQTLQPSPAGGLVHNASQYAAEYDPMTAAEGRLTTISWRNDLGQSGR